MLVVVTLSHQANKEEKNYFRWPSRFLRSCPKLPARNLKVREDSQESAEWPEQSNLLEKWTTYYLAQVAAPLERETERQREIQRE